MINRSVESGRNLPANLASGLGSSPVAEKLGISTVPLSLPVAGPVESISQNKPLQTVTINITSRKDAAVGGIRPVSAAVTYRGAGDLVVQQFIGRGLQKDGTKKYGEVVSSVSAPGGATEVREQIAEPPVGEDNGGRGGSRSRMAIVPGAVALAALAGVGVSGCEQAAIQAGGTMQGIGQGAKVYGQLVPVAECAIGDGVWDALQGISALEGDAYKGTHGLGNCAVLVDEITQTGNGVSRRTVNVPAGGIYPQGYALAFEETSDEVAFYPGSNNLHFDRTRAGGNEWYGAGVDFTTYGGRARFTTTGGQVIYMDLNHRTQTGQVDPQILVVGAGNKK